MYILNFGEQLPLLEAVLVLSLKVCQCSFLLCFSPVFILSCGFFLYSSFSLFPDVFGPVIICTINYFSHGFWCFQ